MARNQLTLWLLLLTLLFFVSCKQSSETITEPNYTDKPKAVAAALYHFAIHPLYNPQKLNESYQPLMRYLNQQLQGGQVELEASRDYQAYEQKYQQSLPEILLPNPWHTIQAMQHGYHVIAMAGAAQDFKGIFIARKDAAITTPDVLKGKIVSYPSYTAIAACVMPQYFLYHHGIDIKKDIKNDYVGSQESSIMNAYLGKSAIAVTWPPPWRAFQKDYPKEASELTLVWETESLMNNSVMVRNDTPADIEAQLKILLLTLANTNEGQAILKNMETDAFYPADNASYQVVADYLSHFERDVRKVDTP
jgi:phosphonate transport system substrate-binding protein